MKKFDFIDIYLFSLISRDMSWTEKEVKKGESGMVKKKTFRFWSESTVKQ